MINAIAIAILLRTIGLGMLLLSKPMLVMPSSNSENMLKSTREVVEEVLPKVEETLMETKDAFIKGVEKIAKPVEKSMGWFRRKPKLDDHLTVVKEKSNVAKEAMHETNVELNKESLEKLNSAAQSNIHNAIGDKTSQIIGAINNVAKGDEYKAESSNEKIEQKIEDVGKVAFNPTVDKIGKTRDSIYSGVGHIKEKLQDIVLGAKDEACDVGIKTKDKTSKIVEFSKDMVNEGVHHTQDIMVGSLQKGLDKTKSTIADVSKKVQDIVEHTTHDTKEIGYGILERMNDATCKTMECEQIQAKEARSYLSNLDKGVGHAYIEGCFDPSLKKTSTRVDENVEEMDKNAKARAKDATNSDKSFARQSCNNIKNMADHYYHKGKDYVGEDYDSITNIAKNYYNENEPHYGQAKDYNDGSINYHKSRGDRYSNYFERDVSPQSNYFDNIKDKTTHASNGAYHKTKNLYDNSRDKLDGYINNKQDEESGEYDSMGRQRIANDYHNVHNHAKDYYKNAKFEPEKALSAVVESMGWRRVGIVAPNYVPISSNDEVVIGNVKYEWHKKAEHSHREIVSDSTLNSIKDAKHNMDERIEFIKKHITRGVQNVQDVGAQIKNQIHGASLIPQDDRSQLEEKPWNDHGIKFQEYEDDNDDEDDDYISSRKIRNRVKGRMRNGGHFHKSQRVKTKKYVDLAKNDLLRFFDDDEDDKNLEEGHILQSWKKSFLKRPEGLLLLLTRALHLFTFSAVYGSSFWVTFVSGLILSKHVPRQQFGYVQSCIFPVYLRILIAGQSILFILHSILHPWFIADSVERWELLNFGLMIVSTLINTYVFEPQATKVMFEQLKVEKEERRGLENVASSMDTKLLMEEHTKKLASINQQFKTLHNYSSALNLISLGGLTCHLWHLAHRLVI